ncbi:hypothetical protein EVA_11577 [gut metagenome]|uniref:Uncharacterized protein n=1 Tax=gut metagenome TaxID=749906 RepID=J9GEV2_9ZZZZ
MNVNSHFRPVEFRSIFCCSSFFPMVKRRDWPPCTNRRKTKIAPRSDTRNHQ